MSPRPFLITGLPRSRTAWLTAVANTVMGAICHHEPAQNFASWEASLSLWSDPRYCWVGISDASMGLHLPKIMKDHRPRTLIVQRNKGEVAAALAALGIPPTNYCDLLYGRLQEFVGHRQVMTVPFERLGDSSVIVECLGHLMPGAIVDQHKIAALQRLNVQCDIERTRSNGLKADPVAMLGADVVAELRAG